MKNVIRVCGALIDGGKILMVKHREADRIYWTLPGGGLEGEETPQEGIIREFMEETNLPIRVTGFLFDEEFMGELNRCFMVESLSPGSQPSLGYDPEEKDLPDSEKMLLDLQWKNLEEMENDRQVSRVLQILSTPTE